MDTQQTNLTVASKKELLGKKEKMKRKAINETEEIFFCLLVVGETRDWITSARPLQSRSASRFPSRFSAAHIIDTQRSSALDVEQGQSSSCLPPLILYSPPRTFFLSGILHHYYYSTIHLFTIFTISVHTHICRPQVPRWRENFLGGDVRFPVPSVYKTQAHRHTHTKETWKQLLLTNKISLSRKKFYFIFSLNSVTMRTNSLCVCVCVCM
jgi:hypothetical protein